MNVCSNWARKVSLVRGLLVYSKQQGLCGVIRAMDPHQWCQSNQSFGLMPHMFPHMMNPPSSTGWPVFPGLTRQGMNWGGSQLSSQAASLPRMSPGDMARMPTTQVEQPPAANQCMRIALCKRTLVQEDAGAQGSMCLRLGNQVSAHLMNLCSQIGKTFPRRLC